MVQLAIWVLSGLTVASAIIIFGATIMNATRVRIMCSLASVCVLVLICLNVYWSEDPTTYIQRYPLAFAIFSPLYLDLVIVLFLDVGLKFHEALGMRGPDAWFYIIVVVAVANTIYDYTGVVVEHYYEVGPDMRWLMFVTQISIAISLALASALYALVPLMLTVRRKSAPNSHAFAVGVWYFALVLIIYATYAVLYSMILASRTNFDPVKQSFDLCLRLIALVAQSLPAPRVVIVKIRAILFDSQMRQRTGSSGGIGIRVSVNQRSAVPSDFDTITTDTYFPLSVISGESSPRRPIFELMSKDSYDSGSDTGGSVPPSPMKPFHQYGSRLSPVYEGGSEESYSDSTTVDSSRPPRGVAKNKVSPNLSAITVVTDDDEIYINPQNHFYNKSKPQRTSSNLSPYTSTPYGSNVSLPDDDSNILPHRDFRKPPSRPVSRIASSAPTSTDSNIVPERDYRRKLSQASTVSIPTQDDIYLRPDSYQPSPRSGSFVPSPHSSVISVTTDDEVYINPQHYSRITLATPEKKSIVSKKSVVSPPPPARTRPDGRNHHAMV